MLNYIQIVNCAYGLKMSGREIAKELGISKSGVNDFLQAFRECPDVTFPLPDGMTNTTLRDLVYESRPGRPADARCEVPDFSRVAEDMRNKSNMTLLYQWQNYSLQCERSDAVPYSYRQFCRMYSNWCDANEMTYHFSANPGERMEVDFAGQTFGLTDRTTGECRRIVVFVAVLAYSQCIYAEGMTSTAEAEWINVNNNALAYFGGSPAVAVPDNCKQAVLCNRDWIAPELNPAYMEWANWNHVFLAPAKVRRPTFKSSVEASVGILEKGFFHDLEELTFYSLSDFNNCLWKHLDDLNRKPFAKKDHCRFYYLEIEKNALTPLPPTRYEYAETRTAKVRSDSHVQFSNAYYSVDQSYVNQTVNIRATAQTVRIYAQNDGALLAEWPRAEEKGAWLTNPEHLPEWYRELSSPSVTKFVQKAEQIGPNTAEVIKRLFENCEVPVQGFRRASGILKFAAKYSAEILEECCRRSLKCNKGSYTHIRTTIPVVAEDMTSETSETQQQKRNENTFAAPSENTSLEQLLADTARLLENQKGNE